MNISDIGIVFAICSSVVTGGGFIATTLGDQRYLLVAESLQGKISDYQEKIYLLEKDGITPSEQEDIDFYNLQIKQLDGNDEG